MDPPTGSGGFLVLPADLAKLRKLPISAFSVVQLFLLDFPKTLSFRPTTSSDQQPRARAKSLLFLLAVILVTATPTHADTDKSHLWAGPSHSVILYDKT